jgi:hypothetical protein
MTEPKHYFLHVADDGTEIHFASEPTDGTLTLRCEILDDCEITRTKHVFTDRGTIPARPRGSGWGFVESVNIRFGNAHSVWRRERPAEQAPVVTEGSK